MIEINNLTYNYQHQKILENITFNIEDGDFVLITGENGSGKTTLLKCVLGINKVDNNMIKIDGIDINKFKNFTEIGYIEQFKKNTQDVSITAQEYFKLITNNQDEIDRVVRQMKIEKLINKDISTMSGGERQKVVIARSLLKKLKYLILDEPNTGLDFKSRKEMYEYLTELNKKGITIIIISHHKEEITCKINKLYEIKEHELIMEPKENCEYC